MASAESEASGSSEHPFPLLPAPWKAKGTMIVLLHKSPTDFAGAGGYDQLEEPVFTDAETSGAFVPNSLGTVMIVRYTDIPTGAYDELLFTPGSFPVPPQPKLPPKLRVAKIYLSSLSSTYNGRRNWNMPKHFGHFTFSPPDFDKRKELPSTISVEVRHNESDPKPFFRAEFQPISWQPTIPGFLFDTNNIPKSIFDLTLYMPPLPQSPDWRLNGEVGTDRWHNCFAGMRAKGGVKPVWALPGLKNEDGEGKDATFGDGVSFPDVKLWKYGFFWRDVEFVFNESSDIEGLEGREEGEQGKKTK